MMDDISEFGRCDRTVICNQRFLVEPKLLSIAGIHDMLQQIATQEGKGSQNQWHTLIKKLLHSCKSHEMKFLVQTLLGNMQLGANEWTVLFALANFN
jgi:DNA ligase-1